MLDLFSGKLGEVSYLSADEFLEVVSVRLPLSC
jgi:hypothetical protein